MMEGFLPFKYLGVPLTSRKIKYIECKTLLQHILKDISQRSTSKLSYGARACIISSVLEGMKAY